MEFLQRFNPVKERVITNRMLENLDNGPATLPEPSACSVLAHSLKGACLLMA